jgi:hypothetical protein
MITIAEKYRLPTCWADIVWADYEPLVQGTIAFLQYLAIPEQILVKHLDLVKQALSFLDEDIPACETEDIDAYELSFDTYISILLCKTPIEVLATYDLRNTAYTEKELVEAKNRIAQEPIVQRLRLVQKLRNAVEQIEKELAEHYKKYQVPLTQAQKMARIDEFNKRWGYYVVADMLAGGVFLKKKEVFQTKMIDIVVEIKYLNEKNYYHHKLQKELEYEQRRNYKRHA